MRVLSLTATSLLAVAASIHAQTTSDPTTTGTVFFGGSLCVELK